MLFLIPLLLWIIIIIVFLPIYIAVAIPLIILRFFVNTLVYFLRPDLINSLNSRDLVFTYDDFYGEPRKNVVNITISNGRYDIETLRREFKKRILDQKEYIRLHCRPFVYFGYWFWQVLEIDLTANIYEMPFPKKLESGEFTDEEMNEFLLKYVKSGYRKESPLWEAVYVPLAGNRTACLIKMHHIVGDGVSFMSMLEKFCDGNWVHTDVPKAKSFTLSHWLYAWFWFPYKSAKAYYLARTMKGFRPKGHAGEGLISMIILPLEKIRVIKREHKVLFSSVLAGLLSSGFKRIQDKYPKLDKPSHVRMVIPVPWPGRREYYLCNHVGWLNASSAIDDDIGQVMTDFEKSVKYGYVAGLHGIIWYTFRYFYIMPNPLLLLYTRWGERNIPPVILTTIPGTTQTVNLFGQKILHSYPIQSLGCSTGVNACVTQYAEGAYYTIRVSKQFIPTKEILDQLLKFISEELDANYLKAIDGSMKNNNDYVKIAMPPIKA